jgi:hypothetical protein
MSNRGMGNRGMGASPMQLAAQRQNAERLAAAIFITAGAWARRPCHVKTA